MVSIRFNNKIISVVLHFLLVCCMSCNSNPTDAAVTDAETEKAIQEKMVGMNGYSAVQVAVRNNIVFLTGQCVGEGCAKVLENRIREVDGVVAVENDITEGRPPVR